MTARQVRRSAAATLLAVSAADPPPLRAQPVSASPVATVVLTPLVLDESMARPTLDGVIDDEAWTAATPYTDFVQQEPNDGQPATERTEVRVLVDRTAIYIGVISFDSEPDKIVFTQSKRDASLTETDSIQVVLDTFNDSQNGFVFGTDAMGIEYDGQVAGEGQTGGMSQRGSGGQGSQRGQITGFNPNWDGNWQVKSQITGRGWETELVIPLKTLRYSPGEDRTWGFNVMRNIRRKNEQVYFAPVARGYSLNTVSQAAKLTGLDLPRRRDLKIIPFAATNLDKDFTAAQKQFDADLDVGADVKWGVTPSLTLDFTVNTDFAQTEADDEQINLTRFPLFFPEKRSFFLENASTFQFGLPQTVDLFFSRRIGLSPNGEPIGIIGGSRLSGKAGRYNVGVLNMYTESTTDPRTDLFIAPANGFTVARVQREIGRSNVGAIFVNRYGFGDRAEANRYNNAYGIDSAWQATRNGKLFTFIARTDSTDALGGSDWAGAASYQYANPLFNANLQYVQVGETFNPEVGFLPRRGYRFASGRYAVTYQPKSPRFAWIRRFAPHVSQNVYWGIDRGEIQSSYGHYHLFEIQPARGGRFGVQWDRYQDRPVTPFVVYSSPGRPLVVIPPGFYTWNQVQAQYFHDPSAPIYYNVQYTYGGFYDGDASNFTVTLGGRIGSTFSGSVSWTRDDIDLPYGSFHNDLIPVRLSYSFTRNTSLQGLIQYNSQTEQVSSNLRFAILNRSGTGLFVVYNDRQDTSSVTPLETLGRSFIVKYTRLFDF